MKSEPNTPYSTYTSALNISELMDFKANPYLMIKDINYNKWHIMSLEESQDHFGEVIKNYQQMDMDSVLHYSKSSRPISLLIYSFITTTILSMLYFSYFLAMTLPSFYCNTKPNSTTSPSYKICNEQNYCSLIALNQTDAYFINLPFKNWLTGQLICNEIDYRTFQHYFSGSIEMTVSIVFLALSDKFGRQRILLISNQLAQLLGFLQFFFSSITVKVSLFSFIKALPWIHLTIFSIMITESIKSQQIKYRSQSISQLLSIFILGILSTISLANLFRNLDVFIGVLMAQLFLTILPLILSIKETPRYLYNKGFQSELFLSLANGKHAYDSQNTNTLQRKFGFENLNFQQTKIWIRNLCLENHQQTEHTWCNFKIILKGFFIEAWQYLMCVLAYDEISIFCESDKEGGYYQIIIFLLNPLMLTGLSYVFVIAKLQRKASLRQLYSWIIIFSLVIFLYKKIWNGFQNSPKTELLCMTILITAPSLQLISQLLISMNEIFHTNIRGLSISIIFLSSRFAIFLQPISYLNNKFDNQQDKNTIVTLIGIIGIILSPLVYLLNESFSKKIF